MRREKRRVLVERPKRKPTSNGAVRAHESCESRGGPRGAGAFEWRAWVGGARMVMALGIGMPRSLDRVTLSECVLHLVQMRVNGLLAPPAVVDEAFDERRNRERRAARICRVLLLRRRQRIVA